MTSGNPNPGTRPSNQPAIHKEWRSRGYLPHFDRPGLIQFITFRLHDSLPKAAIEQMKAELNWIEGLPSADPREVGLRRRIAQLEDAGHGTCYLRDPALATVVQDTLLLFDGARYRLLAWCVMPNHVHVLVETLPGYPLDTVVHSWKSFTAHAANRILKRRGEFWMPEYFDRFIRDEEHLSRAIWYIHENPVKARLVTVVTEWPFSSVGSGG
jgi:putative transposase